MGTLYRLDFPNGKNYIGVTTKALSRRFNNHVYNAACGDPGILYRAWRKNGAPALVPLAIVEDRLLKATEQAAVTAFGTLYPLGYNLTPGGECNPMDMPLSRAKVSAKMKGRKQSAEHLRKLSAVRLGRFCSPETRAKMSASHTGRKHSAVSKAKMSKNNAMKRPEVVAKFLGSLHPSNRHGNPFARPESRAKSLYTRIKNAAIRRGKIPPRRKEGAK